MSLSKQGILNRAWYRLRKQGRKSVTEDESIEAYRGTNGAMCGVGAVMPDRVYDPCVENRDIMGLLDTPATLLKHPRPRLWNAWTRAIKSVGAECLLQDIQLAHDDLSQTTFSNSLETSMHELARKHGLQPLPLGYVAPEDRA